MFFRIFETRGVSIIGLHACLILRPTDKLKTHVPVTCVLLLTELRTFRVRDNSCYEANKLVCGGGGFVG